MPSFAVRVHAATRVALLAVAALLPPAMSAQAPVAAPVPPVAERRAKVDTLHGDVRRDDWFWMRDRKDPAVIRYLEAENAYTESMQGHLAPLRETLYREMVGRIKETDLGVPYRQDGWWYYRRTEKGKNYPIFCRKRGTLDAPEEVIFDQNEAAKPHKFYTLGGFEPSPDGSKLALLVDTTGYEDFTLRVKDLATGAWLPDRREKVGFGLAWASDNRTLFYAGMDSAKRNDRVFRHRLGTPVASDVQVFHEPDVLFYVRVGRTRSGRFVTIGASSFTSSEWRVIDAARPDGAPRLVAARRPGVEYDVDHGGGFLWIVTNADGARNFKVARVADDAPDLARWRDWLPARAEAFVEGIDVFREWVVVSERREGLRRLRVTRLATDETHDVTFPEAAYGVFPSQNEEFDATTFRFSYSSLVTPSQVTEYDLATRTRKVLKEQEVLGGYDRTQYVVERRMAPGRDGTMIPVSIVHRKGVARDGRAPLLLYAYGSYGATTEPTFSSQRLSLLDRGMVYAIAHVRGGQEMGRQWYDDGKMLRKRNTFWDFQDVGKFLVAERYTSSDRMVANGGSAGGLLMGVVANEAPTLFTAIVAAVPFVDVINTMADASIPLTAQEWEQWGNPAKAEEYAYLKQYSPYDNVRAQGYPAMLVTSGINDSRVAYWEPTKWVAKLRTMKTDANPLLLRMNLGAGHGGASGRYDRLKEVAFDYAFILDRVGLAQRTVP